MSPRDSIYRLKNLIEFDDTLVGGKKAGKRGWELPARNLSLLRLRKEKNMLILWQLRLLRK
jgi:hypothetical protein